MAPTEDGIDPQFAYHKRPVLTEAYQYTRETFKNCDSLPRWVRDTWNNTMTIRYEDGQLVTDCVIDSVCDNIVTSWKGTWKLSEGDWLVLREDGRIHSYTDDRFRRTYQKTNP